MWVEKLLGLDGIWQFLLQMNTYLWMGFVNSAEEKKDCGGYEIIVSFCELWTRSHPDPSNQRQRDREMHRLRKKERKRERTANLTAAAQNKSLKAKLTQH